MNPPPEGALTISNHTSSIREPKIMPNQSKHRRTEATDSGSTTSSLYITFPPHTGQRKGTVTRFPMRSREPYSRSRWPAFDGGGGSRTRRSGFRWFDDAGGACLGTRNVHRVLLRRVLVLEHQRQNGESRRTKQKKLTYVLHILTKQVHTDRPRGRKFSLVLQATLPRATVIQQFFPGSVRMRVWCACVMRNSQNCATTNRAREAQDMHIPTREEIHRYKISANKISANKANTIENLTPLH